ncbi:MAG: SLBB domain-containing protein, partial [Gemmatimonadota bacterium]|nr:SLBB domain-containing protein [Gemmatimonadota bacterium]
MDLGSTVRFLSTASRRMLTLVAAATLLTAVAPVQAQIPADARARALMEQDPEEVRRALAESGMSQAEIRSQLAAAGMSATLLDGFLVSDDSGIPARVDSKVVAALQALELDGYDADGLADVPFVSGMQDSIPSDSIAPSPVFGLDVFRRASSQFQPLLTGPAPDDYELGPGDELVVVLTGDVEIAHELQVNRGGFIVIPDVGRVSVANQPMRSVQGLIRRRLAQSYSGVAAGTTTVDVTLAKFGVNQIYVTGEIAQPGAYQLSSIATVTNALYAAGGPTELGSLRDVRVRRRTGEEVSLDLYPYLLSGRVDQDVILRQGDVIFVPLRGRRVRVAGAVQRPAQYELREGEDLKHLLEASGGFAADARRDRVTVHRILLPGEARGGAPRAAIDLELPPATDRNLASLPVIGGVVVPAVGLQDGDSVVVDRVPAVTDGLYVTIGGLVEGPGQFPWRPGTTLLDLILLARGPLIGADLRHAEVSRLPEDRTGGSLATIHRVPLDRRALSTNELLSGGGGGGAIGAQLPDEGSIPDFYLEPFDDVRILRLPDFEMQRTVFVAGEVPVPGRYALETRNDRVTDVLARAGGLLPSAYAPGARLIRSQGRLGSINLDLASALKDPSREHNLALEPGDSLFIPVYSPTVTVRGAVNSPVTVLYEEGRGVDYYVENAGGFRHDADQDRLSVRYAN